MNWRSLGLVTLLFGVANCLPNITGVSPYWVGLEGGQYLYIDGERFSGDQFSHFDVTLGNRVYLVNEVDTIECDVVNYLTNTEQIVCTTRRRISNGAPNIYAVMVHSDGVQAEGGGYVEYQSWAGPVITAVVPTWTTDVDAIVSFKGWFRTDQTDAMDVSDPTGTPSQRAAKNKRMIKNVQLHDTECEIINATTSQVYYLTSSELHCYPKTLYIGPVNASMLVNTRGYSAQDKSSLFSNSYNILYQHHRTAVVHNVSARSGSVGGGTLITITGIGFTLGYTEVRVGGAVCRIVNITYNSITCLTPPEEKTGPAPGGQGFSWRTWEVEGIDIEHEESVKNLTSFTPTSSNVVSELKVYLDKPSFGILSGVLNARTEGFYRLGIHHPASTETLIFVGPNGKPENKTKFNNWQEFYLEGPSYVEIRYLSIQSGDLEVELCGFNSSFTSAQTWQAYDERQRLQMRAEAIPDIQLLRFPNITGFKVKFLLNGFISEESADVTDANDIQDAINSLLEYKCEKSKNPRKTFLSWGAEVGEERPPYIRGWEENAIDPHCGRVSWMLDNSYPRIYREDNEEKRINMKETQYLCLALRGNYTDEMRVRFVWEDKQNRDRVDDITFTHTTQDEESTLSWRHKCIDLLKVMTDSWIGNYYKDGKAKVSRVFGPYSKKEYEDVYLDDVSFVSDTYTLTQIKPGAFHSKEISVSGVEVRQNTDVSDVTILSYDIVFTSSNCQGGYPLLGIKGINDETSISLALLEKLDTAESVSFDVDGEEITTTRTQAASYPVGGSWDLNFANGVSIEDISPDVSEKELEDRIRTSLGNDRIDVDRDGSCTKRNWHVTWTGNPGRKELMAVNQTKLTYDVKSLSFDVARTSEGRLCHKPVWGDHLSTYQETPEVTVDVNGYRSLCDDDCAFIYSEEGRDVVDSAEISLDSGVYTVTVTSSTGFSTTDMDAFIVLLGDKNCPVTSAESTAVKCAKANLTAGTYSVSVLVQPVGAAKPTIPLSVSVDLSLDSIEPISGGVLGGYEMILSLTGMPSNTDGSYVYSVTVGESDCEVTETDSEKSELVCIVPSGTPGTVDVSVKVDDLTATLNNAFVYNATMSPTVTSALPATISVFGTETMTISGSNFGTNSEGFVKVGPQLCERQSWTDVEIQVRVPSGLAPGPYSVTVSKDGKGDVSIVGSVTVVLKVTGTSRARGSVNGGTVLVIKGQGFGQNCSLIKVSMGPRMTCDVIDCSDDSITCVTRKVAITHIVTNNGSLRNFGSGFAWNPKIVTIQTNDIVKFEWKTEAFSQRRYKVFKSNSPTDKDYNGGFDSGPPTSQGSYSVQFPDVGTTFYASGPIAEGEDGVGLVMSGKVVTTSFSEEISEISVSVMDVEANYAPSAEDISVSLDECGGSPGLNTPLSGCESKAPEGDANTERMYFTTDICDTPKVTQMVASEMLNYQNIRGLQVPVGVSLIFSGSGFGSNICQVEVTAGDAPLQVTAVTDESLECKLVEHNDLVSLKTVPLKVKIRNRGIANMDVKNPDNESRITIGPVVNSSGPEMGSVAGGTLVTISGSGLLSASGQASVTIGSNPCHVVSVSSTSITCRTEATDAGTYSVSVYIPPLTQPINEDLPLNFVFSEAATPTVNQITVEGVEVSIEGLQFGRSLDDVSVEFVVAETRKKRSVQKEDFSDRLTLNERHQRRERSAKILKAAAEAYAGMYDEEAEEPRSSHQPKINIDLFDDLPRTSNFWREFTGVPADTFVETKEMGAWRIGGSLPKMAMKADPVPQIHRTKRDSMKKVFKCTPELVTNSKITCKVDGIHSGKFSVNVNIKGSGYAKIPSGAAVVLVTGTLDSVTPEQGSINGGTLLTINGTGFKPGYTNVTIDGDVCVLVTEEADTLTCTTQAHTAGQFGVEIEVDGNTISGKDFTFSDDRTMVITTANPNSGLKHGDELTIDGSRLNCSGESPMVMIGDAKCPITDFQDTTIKCTAPDLPGGTYRVCLVNPVCGDSNCVNVTYDMSITSVEPNRGGFGGINIVINGTGFDSADKGSTVTVCDKPCSPVSISSTSLTCTTSPTNDSASTVPCNVVITNPSGSVDTLANGFTYDDSLTPSVHSISPERGGTAGGTEVNIKGSGFAASGNTVSIDGSECILKSENIQEIVCVTESHKGPGKFKPEVTVPGSGLAETNAEFFYIDRWSSVYTWGGEPVPSEGQLVVIEEDQTVLMDTSTEVLKMLLIKGGHVVFDAEATEELFLRAEYILIVEGGSLSIGSERDPFLGQATIELHGNIKSIELPNYGAKVMAVRNGSLELHGKPVPVTWTHLATTADVGDTSIDLVLAVDWNPGDQIVIATTERRFFRNENEKRTIESVSATGKTLQLTEPLAFQHVSMEQTLGGRSIETRGEVGLLTRNVKIRGAVNADFTREIEACKLQFNSGQFSTQTCNEGIFGAEKGSDQFGGTVMLSGKFQNQNLVSARIEYVEVTEAGQAFQLGRYPLHFHLVGNVTGSYIRGCSVHRTYNRAITIHAADYLLVERNVVYNNMGHAIFTEDGVEQFNIIQYNLAVYTRSSNSLLNVDVTPASYWLVNANNIVRHNAAAGSTHFGYWYRPERFPTGPSATTSYCPYNALMGEFTNNTAHSIGRYGLWIFGPDGIFPTKKDCGGTFKTIVWSDFTVWRSQRGAEFVSGGAGIFENFMVLDNEIAGIEMVQVAGSFGPEGPGVRDSLLIGHSNLTPEGCSDKTSGIVGPQKSIFNIYNTTFVNYDTGLCSALSGGSQGETNQGDTQAQVSNLKFENAPNKLRFKWKHETVWIDADGSLVGTNGEANSKIVPDMEILPESCVLAKEFSVNPEVPGVICPPSTNILRLEIDGESVIPESLMHSNLTMTNSVGNMIIPYQSQKLLDGWMALVIAGDEYNLSFDGNEQITNMSYAAQTQYLGTGDYVLFKHKFSQTPDGISTTNEEKNSSLAPLDPSVANNGDYYWRESNMTLEYIVSEKDTNRRKRATFDDREVGAKRNIDLQVYRCRYENCLPPTIPDGRPNETLRWSDKETWKKMPVGTGGHPTNGTYNLPVEGDEVWIPQGIWLIVDTAVPALGRVYVYGALEFEDTMNHYFEATIIYIEGGKVVAGESEENPFTNDLTIALRGSKDSSNPDNIDLPLPDGTPNAGWKAIAVFGELALFGQGPTDGSPSWAKLKATANAGDSRVTLTESVNATFWTGKQVVVTTSGKEVTESEVCPVLSVEGPDLVLDCTLKYEHLGATHYLGNSDNGKSYRMASEVGLLGRNIRVEGVGSNDDEAFGARVLVGKLTRDGQDFTGNAKLSNVEFHNVGQDGFVNIHDPRYSLVFYDLGTDEDGDNANNFVKKCSFHKNMNYAIGLIGSNNILMEGNVIYRSVGAAFYDASMNNRYIKNLAAVSLFTGRFNGRNEVTNMNMDGSFNLNDASGFVLEGNVVAGAEQAAYLTYGEDCEDDTLWRNNEAHSAMYGVMVWMKQHQPKDNDLCKRISNFYVWRAWDAAVYMLHYASLVVEDVRVVDSQVGVYGLVYAPPALSHLSVDKYVNIQNSCIVCASPSYTCSYQESEAAIADFYHGVLWPHPKVNTGIVFPSFASGPNGGPKFPMFETSSYPAISGKTTIKDMEIHSCGDRTCGRDVAMSTNSQSDDAIHPIFSKNVTFTDTPEDNKMFMHRPNLDVINPSDCVDMDCDGLKKVVFTDLDGSVLGGVNDTAISQAEYEWDGDPQRGIGDNRIPTSMKVNLDGSKIEEAEKYPNKGIYRDDSCTKMEEWNAYRCSSVSYRMMVLQSMDKDTEGRRLSPVGVMANPGTDGYVDLLNGPMDRGWCLGYTCQERISTFYSIIAISQNYDIALTSTPPQVLRLQLLHSDPSEAVILKLYYPKSQRYDVYVDNVFVPPTNIDTEKYPELYRLKPQDDSFFPTYSQTKGSNYWQRKAKLLHVLVRGSHVYDIRTQQLMLLSLGIVIDPDNFFEEDIVNNVALLLGVSPENVRMTNVIREDSKRRRKRAAEENVKVEFEVGDPPPLFTNSTNGTSSPTSVTNLTQAAANIVNRVQLAGSATNSNLTIRSLAVTEPLPVPEEPGPSATEEDGAGLGGPLFSEVKQQEEAKKLEANLKATNFDQPSSAQLSVQPPSSVQAFSTFSANLTYVALSAEGTVINSLGHISDPSQVTAFVAEGPLDAVLLGTTTVTYADGAAVFDSLAIGNPGDGYKLGFYISHPNPLGQLNVTSNAFEVTKSEVKDWSITSAPTVVESSQFFSVSMKPEFEFPVKPEYLQGQTLSGEITLHPDGVGKGTLSGTTSFTVKDGDIMNFAVGNISITGAGRFKYEINGTVSPANWSVSAYGFLDVVKNTSLTIKVLIRASRKSLNSQGREKQVGDLLQGVLRHVVGTHVSWSDVTVILYDMVPFAKVYITGNGQDLEDALAKLCKAISQYRIKIQLLCRRLVMVDLRIMIDGNAIRCRGNFTEVIHDYIIKQEIP